MALQLLKDGKTFADVNSEKPKICFLHGWGRSSDDFSKISKKFESIAIDLPGFGKSEEPENSMNPKEYAEYLTNLIPDTVEVLVGHSFGGKIAVHMSFIKKYFITSSLNHNKIITPFMFLFLMEIFPLKSSGSFFTTGNATFIFLVIALTVALSREKNLN